MNDATPVGPSQVYKDAMLAQIRDQFHYLDRKAMVFGAIFRASVLLLLAISFFVPRHGVIYVAGTAIAVGGLWVYDLFVTRRSRERIIHSLENTYYLRSIKQKSEPISDENRDHAKFLDDIIRINSSRLDFISREIIEPISFVSIYVAAYSILTISGLI